MHLTLKESERHVIASAADTMAARLSESDDCSMLKTTVPAGINSPNEHTIRPTNTGIAENTNRIGTSTQSEELVVFPWSRRIEEYLLKMKNICLINHQRHSEARSYFRWWGHFWAVPSVLIPLVCSPLIPILKGTSAQTCTEVTGPDILTMVGFIATSVTSTISKYYAFDSRAHEHDVVSAKYSELILDIEAIMLPPKKFRQSPNVFIDSFRIRYNYIVGSEPHIPTRLQRKHSASRSDIIEDFVESDL